MSSVKAFFSYCHSDEGLRDELEKHLALMKRQGLITAWHDRKILPGEDFSSSINENIKHSDLIFLLVSSDFLNSDYCYGIEAKIALDRHKNKEAIVVPIILRACDWKSAPFGALKALPLDAKAVTSWQNRDEAYENVALEVRRLIGGWQKNP